MEYRWEHKWGHNGDTGGHTEGIWRRYKVWYEGDIRETKKGICEGSRGHWRDTWEHNSEYRRADPLQKKLQNKPKFWPRSHKTQLARQICSFNYTNQPAYETTNVHALISHYWVRTKNAHSKSRNQVFRQLNHVWLHMLVMKSEKVGGKKCKD